MTAPARRAVAVAVGLLAFVAPATAAHSLWTTQAAATFTVTVPAAPMPPPLAAPGSFSCTRINPAVVDLAWSTSDGAEAYRIYRTGDSARFAEVAAPATSATSVNRDTWGIAMGESATLVVRAVTAQGAMSPASNPVSVTFGPGATCSPGGSS
jgi:hypothetical protein